MAGAVEGRGLGAAGLVTSVPGYNSGVGEGSCTARRAGGTGQATGDRRPDDSNVLWRRVRMAYLSCPSCGMTLFDRNPLTAPRHCGRCARRHGAAIELERVTKLGGAAAASVLGEQPTRSEILPTHGLRKRRDRSGDVPTP